MPPPNRNAEYRAVRGLTRGLDLLLALNASANGRASSGELSVLTGLHRTTVRRMLETLADDGYVRRSESDDSFRLTLKVKQLSDGFTDGGRLSTLATPVMGELLKTVVWPSDLAAPDGGVLQICESTRRFSPLSFHGSLVGRKLPYLLTSAGRAYFSYCRDEEREQILELLRMTDDVEGRLARDDRFIENLVRTVRAEGMGTNNGEWAPEKKIGAIAMPIFSGDQVLGSLNVVYLAQAVTVKQALNKFAPPLRNAVDRISALLSTPVSDAVG
ncbi:MAG: DNA-binding transcriptional regulator [Pseudomonadota bacterium]